MGNCIKTGERSEIYEKRSRSSQVGVLVDLDNARDRSKSTRRSLKSDRIPNRVDLLAQKDKRRVKDSWLKLGLNNDQQEMVKACWMRSAERSPKVSEILGLYESEMSPRFSGLIISVHRFFNCLIVQNDLKSEKVLEACYIMGLRHADYSNEMFKPVYWDIFLVSLIDTLELGQFLPKIYKSEEKRDKIIHSWSRFTRLVVHQMLEAYQSEKTGMAPI